MTNYKFIPAPAGTYALWRTESEPGYGRTIITAWQIDAEEIFVSWTKALIEGANEMNVEAILCPDGTVQQIDGGVFWNNVDHWLECEALRLAA